ncbi:branched-chain amino acid ABC transporter substrate-binding protein [Cellulomonas sp. PhB150]|uniref:branched-chain amino acid ABC transporter substrate-binding protein n=1 Tax=Cellulomonas sp. PhB150 TaxID=2485188 RepID=UPI000FB772E3|nr:branched-chain amino acid ABC transporter substrate-binding protein [Cellulomonas sp. PhB150]ROS26261.1 amino acid/amide ABC transporter substrate-binding protein (HAAT family) [Cellulomonas sp. PhB150]
MRSSTPKMAGTALVLVAGLMLAGCSSKDDSGDTPTASGSESAAASGDLSIQPVVQIDTKGEEVPAADTSNAADPAGDGSAKCDPVTIAMAGALTGPNAALGINILNGAKLAVDAHNAANAGCQVTVKEFDTEGDPQKATQVAPSIVGDKSVIGLLGPAFSGETAAVGQVFSDAGLLSLTASATNPDLVKNGWTNFYRGLANDAVQGPSVAAYLVNTLKFAKVCVVQDDSDYGVGLAAQITSGLGDAADSSCAAKVKAGDKDFSATVQIIKTAAPDAVFYAGYYAEGAPFASQLKEAGVTAAFVSADGTNDPQFVKQAGSAAKDAYLSCPCGPAPEKFAADYKAKFNIDSGVYSVEAYDLATIMLKGIDSGVKDRAGLVDFVKSYDGDGLARHYKWDATGELASALIWIYQVK